MTMIAPTAQPGDICILLEPSLEERQALFRDQRDLQSRFGGRICAGIHVTCQLFKVDNHPRQAAVIDQVQKRLAGCESFPIVAGSLITFRAACWHSTVLRWKIHNTSAWLHFRLMVETLLSEAGCPPHYPPTQASTCTALEAVPTVAAPSDLAARLPYPLFDAQ